MGYSDSYEVHHCENREQQSPRDKLFVASRGWTIPSNESFDENQGRRYRN